MVEWLIANWGNIVGVVGVVFALYFGLKKSKYKKLTYVIRSSNIFTGLEHTIPDVEVRFPGYGLPVNRLTVTKVAFWNAGTETIPSQDVVMENPLFLRAKTGVAILSVRVIDCTNRYNKVDTRLDGQRMGAAITFDYLDQNDGALLQIFHTGLGNDDIQLEGTIKGVRSIQRRPLITPQSTKQLSRGLAVPVLCIFWVLLTVVAYAAISAPHFLAKAGSMTELDITIISGVILLGFLITGGVAYSLYTTAVPKGLSKIHWRES